MATITIAAPMMAITEDGKGLLSLATQKLLTDTILVSTVATATYTRRFISGATKDGFGIAGFISPTDAGKFNAIGENGNWVNGTVTHNSVTYNRVHGMTEAIAYLGMGSYGDAYTYFEEIKDADGYWSEISYLIPSGKFYVEEQETGILTATVPFVQYINSNDTKEIVEVPSGKLAIPSGRIDGHFIYMAG